MTYGIKRTLIMILIMLVTLMSVTQARPNMDAMQNYRKARSEFRNQPLPLIEATLVYALALAEQGKADANPNMFGANSGIAQAIQEAKEAREKLSGDEQTKADKLIADYTAKIDQLEKTFKSDTLAEAVVPKDVYAGKDKDKWKNELMSAWKAKYKDDQILSIIFSKADWERKAGEEWNSGYKRWEKYDKSILEVAIVVAVDKKTALIHPAFVNKDNMSGKVVIGVDTKESYGHIEIMRSKLN